MKPVVLLASDHAGFELKEKLKKLMPEIEWHDLGTTDATTSVDYPDFAHKLCEDFLVRSKSNPGLFGVLICGSGIGVSIAANRHKGIRAALVENVTAARLSREHNNAQVLCLGARFVAPEYAAAIARVFFETPFDLTSRHQTRLLKIET